MSRCLSRFAVATLGLICSWSLASLVDAQAVTPSSTPTSSTPTSEAAATAQEAPLPTLVRSTNYGRVISEAVVEFDDGNFAEARALFTRAHELQPSARTLRGIGISSFELRAYKDAVLHLEAALASTVRPLQGALRVEVQELLDRAYGFVGRFTVGPAPSDVRLFVDGIETSLRSSERLVLPIGSHVLEARAPAYQPDRRSVDVVGGENTSLSFTLTLVADAPLLATPAQAAATLPSSHVAAAPAALYDTERRTNRPLYRNPWLWAGVGCAVAVVVTAVAVAAARHDAGSQEQPPIRTGTTLGVVDGLWSVR